MAAASPSIGTYRNASIVSARPVTAGPINTPAPPDSLTAGSQLDRAQEWGPSSNPVKVGRYGKVLFTSNSDLERAQVGAVWPNLLDGFAKIFTAWRRNSFREIKAQNIAGNYGSITSLANFGFRHRIYPVGNPWGSQGGYPGPVPSAVRPMWNNVLPQVWGLRVANPTAGGSLDSTVQAAYTLQNYSNPTEYTPAGTASLSYK